MVTLVHGNGVGTVIKAYRKISHDKKNQDLMTSLVSLKTLNYFKTSFMILNNLGSFYLVSLWHVLMFAARGLSRN